MKKCFILGAVVFFMVGVGFTEETPPPETATVKTKPARVKKKRAVKSSPAVSKTSKSSVKLEDVKKEQKDQRSNSFQTWLNDLKKRIEHSQAKQNKVIAVAAVRGDETPDSPPLYWKGKKAEGPTDMPELKDFESAVDFALAGDPVSAKEKLQLFINSYPKSSLVSDAQETLNRLEAAAGNP